MGFDLEELERLEKKTNGPGYVYDRQRAGAYRGIQREKASDCLYDDKARTEENRV